MAQFTTRRRVVDWLDKRGVSTAAPSKTILDFVLTATGETIEQTTGREFEKLARTGEMYRGDGTAAMYLRHFPVDEGEDFKIWTRTSGESDWNEQTGWSWRVDNSQRFGVLRLTSGTFPAAVAQSDYNVRIDSTAGLVLPPTADPTVPVDLELAAVLLAELALVMQERGSHMLTSESHPDGPSRSFRSFSDPIRLIDDTLKRYKLEW